MRKRRKYRWMCTTCAFSTRQMTMRRYELLAVADLLELVARKIRELLTG